MNARTIGLGAGLFVLLTGVVAPSPLWGQRVRTTRAENVRALPNGVVIARLGAGAEVQAGDTSGRWRQVVISGWIWEPSLNETDRDGFDLVVAAAGGENLRNAPSGDILGRVEEGMLLERVEVRAGWIRVSRAAWIWIPSTEAMPTEPAPVATTSPDVAPESAGRPPADSLRRAQAPVLGTVVSSGAAVLSGPGGDTLALSRPGSELRVLQREGAWVRVQLEGWSWLPEGTGDQEQDVSRLTVDEVVDSPETSRGRVVLWPLQFISFERADQARIDFFAGEPYLLTRAPGGDGRFVYVALSSAQIQDVEGLAPLQTIQVVGRVRAGRSTLTGNPILDLLEVVRR